MNDVALPALPEPALVADNGLALWSEVQMHTHATLSAVHLHRLALHFQTVSKELAGWVRDLERALAHCDCERPGGDA